MEAAQEHGHLSFASFDGDLSDDGKRRVVRSGYKLDDDLVPGVPGVATMNLEDTSWLWPVAQHPVFVQNDVVVGYGALWMATAGVSYALHFDQLGRAPWRQGFFLLQLVGQKTVRLAAPGHWPLLHLHPWCHVAGFDTQLPDLKGDLISWESLRGQFDLLNKSQARDLHRVLHVAVLRPGDIMYIPPAWFHETDADTDSVSLRVLPDRAQEDSDLEALNHIRVAEMAAARLEKQSCSACSFLVELLPRALGAQRARCSAALVLASMYSPASRGEACGNVEQEESHDVELESACEPCTSISAQKTFRAVASWLDAVPECGRGLAAVAVAETIVGEMVSETNFAMLQRFWELLLTRLGFEGGEEDRRKLEEECLASEMFAVEPCSGEAAAGAESRRQDL